jgi:CubicO group peptidase (beta-lactamase class C family)
MRIAATIPLLLLNSLALAQEPAAKFPPELEAYVVKALQDWDVPGAALALVQDGNVIVAKGYGVRELGKPELVNDRTIFDTASLTKAFTAAAIATLVDEKKLSWDQPVHTYLPALAFSDSYLTANVTLRDLLSHRVGVRNNSAWYFGNLTREQLLGIFAHLQPQAPFRTKWIYSNIGYQAAAEVAAAVSGLSWEQLVTQRLLEPLGMDCSVANFDRVPATGNYASPHAEIAGEQRPIERETTRMSTAAAGGVQMCARDMATWIRFQLGDGTHEDKRILSSESMEELHAPQMIVPSTPQFRASRQIRLNTITYGFGWNVWDYRGELLLWHTGGGDGQSAFLALLPEKRLGIAFAVNTWRTGGSAYPLHVANRILDHYLASPPRDYLVEYRQSWERNRKRDADERSALEKSRLRKSSPSLPLERYVGLYRDQLMLDVTVTRDANGLALQYANSERAPLEHWHDDTFRVRWARRFAAEDRLTLVTFRVDEHGKSAALQFETFGESVDAERIEAPRESREL